LPESLQDIVQTVLAKGGQAHHRRNAGPAIARGA
jgi:hypothetical protein